MAKGQRNSTVALPFCCVSLTAPKPIAPQYVTKPVTLGDHLRNRRLDSGLLQEELATKLGVSSDTIRGGENNRHEPAIRHVSQILDFLAHPRACS